MSISEEEYEIKNKELKAKLKLKLTDDFLSTLVEAVKTCGWMVDHIESAQFVRWCFDLADKECPDLAPYI